MKLSANISVNLKFNIRLFLSSQNKSTLINMVLIFSTFINSFYLAMALERAGMRLFFANFATLK
ncbi:hypothetical protein SAMN05192574_103359 [Mucilaginibacter gossypiicola]|uniref:Uncharacterized protein n=1 Tax=Mucilaginibacter gossypiicola TaxID=551995 RepID=A0A1H8H1U9_9SPHI|nr:hypothetical protein SAMN05192574_103359 [Mucilaginibacter gossypiicola]